MITSDLRGHGDSDKPMERERHLGGEIWADDLAAVIDAAGLRRPVLVDWSLDGLPMGNYLHKFGDARLAGLNFVVKITDYDRTVMPHAKVSSYEGCGHSPFHEMAPRFNQELAAFVQAANA